MQKSDQIKEAPTPNAKGKNPMIKSTKKTKATHTTPPRVANLETPKAKPASPHQAGDHDGIRALLDRLGAEVSPEMDRVRAENEATRAWMSSQDIVREEVIRGLVERFLPRDDDDAAKAFVTLINLIAHNDDSGDRDSIAMWACDMAYQNTTAYSCAAGKFFDKATAEFRSRVA